MAQLHIARSHKHHLATQRQRGFTIVELLIVIVVIAILAAISIVAYNGIQDRARQTAATSAARQISDKAEIYFVENNSYPENLAVIGIEDSSSTTYQYRFSASSSDVYCATATSGNKSAWVSNEQKTPQEGACPGHGSGGTAAVTNLVLNPSLETSTSNLTFRWFGNAGGTGVNTRETTGGYSGQAFARKTWTVGGLAQDNGFDTSSSTRIPIEDSESYTGSCYLRTNRLDVKGRIGLSWYDESGSNISTSWSSNTSLSSNVWTRVGFTGTAPTNAASVILICSTYVNVNWNPGDTIDGDAFMLTKGTTLHPYADGDSPGWIWNGTPHASTSTGPAL